MMQEHGTKDLTEHEIAAATVFRELLGSKLTERQIGYELARRGYTYTETAQSQKDIDTELSHKSD